jgi:AcrR family transcriptional regulator
VSHTFSARRSANRRRRSETREQILEAARHELKIKPFRDLSVDDLMQGTGMSRTAFYRFFPDREALLLELLEDLWGALAAEARDIESPGEGDSPTSLAALRDLLAENRTLLKAVADATGSDEEFERSYRAFMRDYWIDDFADRIKKAQERGLAQGLDPELAGEALGWMAERTVTQTLEHEPGEVLDTIIAILAKCLLS